MFRPFPITPLTEALADCKRIGVLDRNISLGLGGICWSEVMTTVPRDALVQNYMVGLGGGDIRPENIQELVDDLWSRGPAESPTIVEVG